MAISQTLFVAVGEAAEKRHSAVTVLVDEVQYFSEKELGYPCRDEALGRELLPRSVRPAHTRRKALSRWAMAEFGPDAHRAGDIAEALGVKVTSRAPMRAKLISKGMVYSPAHGEMAFTVIRRVHAARQPDLER